MSNVVALILQLLDSDGLLKLSALRRLPGRRSEPELRQALIAVYGNSLAQLLFDLQRDDLQRLLQRPFRWQRNRYFAPELAHHSKEQLLKFANALLVQGKIPDEFGKESAGTEINLEALRPPAPPKPSKVEKAASLVVSFDDDDTHKTVVASGMRLLVGLTHEWSRPRRLSNVLTALDLEVPERLRASRFQEIVRKLTALGVELSDADSGAVLTPKDPSPGIDARVRLRRQKS